ncbi:MAG: leucyl aminopeptidase [Parcubacteria group bacterium]|nr:leucyl aminopeptidase [Parcubacteria group bacterium]
MKILLTTGKWKVNEVEALIIPMGVKENIPAGLPTLVTQLLSDAIKRKEFTGEKGEIKAFLVPTANSRALRHVIVLGIGKPGHLDMVACSQLVAQVLRMVQSMKAATVGFWLRDVLVETYPQAEHFGELLASYAALATYEFDEYRKKKTTAIKILTLYLENPKEKTPVSRGVELGSLIGRLTNESRNLGNHPSNVATPKHLAQFMLNVVKEEKNLTAKVLGEAAMKKLGMGGILGVGQGSEQESQFIIVEYWGTDRKEAPYVVVGKGVTFDSGGISIKPAAMMDEMKFDMSGAAAAFGVVRLAAAMKLPMNVVCLVPAVENMLGPNAYKPGDILKAMDGSTIEVINTDAEGRIILADALVYARQYKPKAVIDLATLTGAMVVALHDSGAGMFTRDLELRAALQQAGDATGDIAWPMPLPREYQEHNKAKTGDVANLAPFLWGGAITAASFLDHFVAEKYPWAHLDIAGVAWASNGKKHLAPGATGAGVRLVLQYLRQCAS